MLIEPAKRAIAVAANTSSNNTAAARSAGLGTFVTRSWGSRPRLYADVRSADSGLKTKRRYAAKTKRSES
jgi:hypothetical protein